MARPMKNATLEKQKKPEETKGNKSGDYGFFPFWTKDSTQEKPKKTEKARKADASKEIEELRLLSEDELRRLKLAEEVRIRKVQAEKLQLGLQLDRSMVVDINLCEKAIADLATIVRQSVMSLPTSVAKQVASVDNPRVCESILKKRCIQILSEIERWRFNPRIYATKDESANPEIKSEAEPLEEIQ